MTTMTKQDFEFIATTIQKMPLEPRTKRQVAAHFADALRNTNLNFDMPRFLTAAIFPPKEK